MIGIDNSKMDAMVAQIRNAVANVELPKTVESNSVEPTVGAVDFANIFKNQLDQVNHLEKNAQQLQQRFSLGDDSVNLSDVMIASQKSGISMQAAIQVRNKLITAYNDIMNMSI